MLIYVKNAFPRLAVIQMDLIPFSPDRLAEERLKKNLKQSELAKQSRLSQGAISQIEAGIINPSEKRLRALGKALGIKFVADWEEELWELETPHHQKGDRA